MTPVKTPLKNYAVKTLQKRLAKSTRMFLICQTSLTKCIEDQAHFKAAKKNIPFYQQMVAKYDKQRRQLDSAIKILKKYK